MATLELKNIKKSYGKVDVIHGIDMTVQSGEFCVFVGPSGCGKSTLLRMIAGLEDITSGEVVIDGERVNDITAAQRGLAMVFQSYALYPHMSVANNLSFGLQNLNMPKDEISTRVNEAARMLKIEDYLDRKPGQLSGGQRQRVAIGRAVVREPRIFLFDEPLSNLDAELRVATRGEISALHSRLGNTMIYVTHDQVEAMTMADKIAVLRDGQLEQFGAPLDLFNRPANIFVAGFIGSPRMNFLKGELSGSGRSAKVTLADGTAIPISAKEFDVSQSRAVQLGVRPGDLEHAPKSKGVKLHVDSIEQLGSESFVYGRNAKDEALVVTMKGQTSIKAGEAVPVKFDTSAMHIFDEATGQSLRLN